MSQRICDSCSCPLLRHMVAEEGYVRPCLVYGCGCTCFTDQIHRSQLSPRSRRTRNLLGVWDKQETAVVQRNTTTGQYRFPMRADAPCPEGYERVEIRSDKAMEKVEKEAGVLSEVRHYDRNGRGHEKPLPPIPRGVYDSRR
jgi:hypothetical protein